jgi:hypothetical protein
MWNVEIRTQENVENPKIGIPVEVTAQNNSEVL